MANLYLAGVFSIEKLLEEIFGPLGILFGQSGVPSVEQVELDGDNVPLSSRGDFMISRASSLTSLDPQWKGHESASS